MIGRLTLAALQDAGRAARHGVAVGATMVRFVVLDPSLCRLVAHNDRTFPTNNGPVTLCVRCGVPRGR